MSRVRGSQFGWSARVVANIRGQVLAVCTSDSTHITQTACAILKHLYRPGYKYAKAGVMLMELQPATRQQLTLDLDADMPENRIRLMQAMDQINRRYGRGSLVLSSAGGIGAQPMWGMKQERLSSGFTTDWRWPGEGRMNLRGRG